MIRYHGPRAPTRNLNVLLSRNLHTHPPRRTPFRPGPRPTIVPFRASPWVMFFAGVGFLSALFVVLPLVFTLFFPLVVAGVIAYQFKRWRSAKLYDALYRSLQTTKLDVRYRSIRGLYSTTLANILERDRAGAVLFDTVVNGRKMRDMWGDENDRLRSRQLLTFLESRVLESIRNNEDGVREFFLGTDVDSWIRDGYDLQLDTSICSTTGRSIGGKLVMSVRYPLYLVSSANRRKLADVSIVFLDERLAAGSGFYPPGDLAGQDERCPMVISIVPVGTLVPRQFIISTPGASGNNASRLTQRTTRDGRREYTYD